MHLYGTCKAGKVYIDEDIIQDGEKIVEERKKLAKDGMVMILASIDVKRCVVDGYPEIIAKGFPMDDYLEVKICEKVAETIATQRSCEDLNEVGYQVKRAVSKMLMRNNSFPIVLPIFIEA